MKITNSCVVVTGAANGIGLALSKYLDSKGAKIAAVDISEQGLAELRLENSRIHTYQCDVSSTKSTSEVIDEIAVDFSKIDILINCAGVMHSEPVVRLGDNGFIQHDFENWHKVISINLSGLFFVTTCVVQKMAAHRTKGLIVNIGSISSQGNAGQSAYSASKSGVEALTKTWAKEFGHLGIRAVCVSPGFIDTPATRTALNEANLKSWTQKTPLKRLGTTDEVICAIDMVIRNDFFNGRILNLDGGLVI